MADLPHARTPLEIASDLTAAYDQVPAAIQYEGGPASAAAVPNGSEAAEGAYMELSRSRPIALASHVARKIPVL
jgi:hypothetical protein